MDPLMLGFVSTAMYNIATGYAEDQADMNRTPHHHYAEVQCIDEGHSWPGYFVPELEAQLRTSEFVLCIESKVNEHMANRFMIELRSQERLLEIEAALKELMQERENLMKEI